MIGTDIELPVQDGALAGVDFGGPGPGVLLVHGSGHNAAAWAEVAAGLVAHCHPVAVDLRGHGQTTLDSTGPEQYWRDLGEVVASLGWVRPVLVGHSTGGYAVTAVTAAGLVDPAALCVVDGVVLDDRTTAVAAHARWSSPQATEQLRTMFRYGWVADDEQLRPIFRSVRATLEATGSTLAQAPSLSVMSRGAASCDGAMAGFAARPSQRSPPSVALTRPLGSTRAATSTSTSRVR